ncbi:type II toxin-antitoxin system RelE/ParE family toxin [Pseudaminobacter sp. 19-2017]|uniref:Type II toxin-antitoxin system RelE/ParE family toxin n=1 Tax=Pseudaminobacter soli (ex Zhang et al. 2022) TaxID=2831468 RepID=A0A942I2L9_9HYPH|nr:type II toxin-antitoxin system RelE/ParE family toxin [Pseudaminobacter soli]MBS3649892.1 type II toxin-antitoxin system RelE/ParE family toxin [Pseudaminobacter soli]
MREVVWSDDALQDFEASIAYIAVESPKAASLVAERIDTALNHLAEFPTGHQGRVRGTYEKIVQRTPYIVCYALSERRLTVLRIIHGARDWPDDSWPEEG